MIQPNCEFLEKEIDNLVNSSNCLEQSDRKSLKERFSKFKHSWNQKPFEVDNRLEVPTEVKEPQRIRPKPVSDKMLEILHKKVDEMLERGIITKADDAKWISPVVLVKKPDGTYIVTIDY